MIVKSESQQTLFLWIGVLPEVSGWAENLDFRKKWRRRRRNWRRWRRMSSREE
jgi:hypothetical protein